MTGITPNNVGALFYRPAQHINGETEFLVEVDSSGNFNFLSSNPTATTLHDSNVAASVLGKENYRTLLDTVQGRRGNVTKIEDKAHHNVLYIASLPQSVDWAKVETRTQWIPLSELKTMLAQVRGARDSAGSPPPPLSPKFIEMLPLIVEGDHNPLSEIEKSGTTSGLITRNESGVSFTAKSAAAETTFSPLVIPETNEILVQGRRFAFNYKIGGKPASLDSMKPKERLNFLKALQKAAQQAADNATKKSNEAIQKITVSFEQDAVQELQVFGSDPDDPIHTENISSDKQLSESINKANAIARKKAQLENPRVAGNMPVQGVPRRTGDQTCWLGTALHLMAHSWGATLEELAVRRDFPAAKRPLLNQLLHMKRRVLGEGPTPITSAEVQAFITACKTCGYTRWGRDDWGDPKQQSDPYEFLFELRDFLRDEVALLPVPPPTGSIAMAPDNAPTSPPTTVAQKAEALLQSAAHLPNALHIRIQRAPENEAATKNATPLTVEPVITLRGERYELVSAAEHTGTSALGGHYVSYSYSQSTDKWYRCNDRSVTEVKNSDHLMKRLSTQGTDLVYRKVPQRIPEFETAVSSLHSIDKDFSKRVLHPRLVLDAANHLLQLHRHPAVIMGNEGPLTTDAGGMTFIRDSLQEMRNNSLMHFPILKNGSLWTELTIGKDNTGNLTFSYFDPTGGDIPEQIQQLASGSTIHKCVDTTHKWTTNELSSAECLLLYYQFIDRPTYTPQNDHFEMLRNEMKRWYNRYTPNYGFTAARP